MYTFQVATTASNTASTSTPTSLETYDDPETREAIKSLSNPTIERYVMMLTDLSR